MKKNVQIDSGIHERLKEVVKKFNKLREKTNSKMTILVFVNRALEKEIRAYERMLEHRERKQ